MRDSQHALVIGSTGGLGSALKATLESTPLPRVTGWSRKDDGLDLTDEDSIVRMISSLPEPPDLVFLMTGALAIDGRPPEKRFRDLSLDTMLRSFAINAAGPALLLKHLLPILPRGRPATLVATSARLSSIGDNDLGGWMSYRASKAALNQLVRCAAIELRRSHPEVILFGYHPGTIPTPLSRPYARGRYTASPEESAQQLLQVVASRTVSDHGGIFDYRGDPIPW